MTITHLKDRSLAIAEKNLAKGIWKLETAQLWLFMVEQHPEDIVKVMKD